jgi:hypothetical protein
MNEHSSRSHTIFRVVVESRPIDAPADGASSLEMPGTIVAELNLVDLAGSERASLTGADGVRLKEGAAINKSLLALSGVISKLSEGKRGAHIPYRDSKLTRILQNSLGGNTRTVIICAITPAVIFAEETLSTLKFASRAKQILNTAVVNEILSDAALLQRCRQEILQLQAENRRLEEGHSLREVVAERERLLREKDQTEKNFASLQQHAQAMEHKLDAQALELDMLRRGGKSSARDSLSLEGRDSPGLFRLGSPLVAGGTPGGVGGTPVGAGSVPGSVTGKDLGGTREMDAEDSSAVAAAEELRALKEETASLRQENAALKIESAAMREEVEALRLTAAEADVLHRNVETLQRQLEESEVQRKATTAQLQDASDRLVDLEETMAFRDQECTAILADAEMRLASLVSPQKVCSIFA